MYLQCKLVLQVQSKHIKILKKQKNKKQKQKQSSNQLAYSKGKKKKKKEKVHLTNWINKKKKHYSWAFGSFYIVNRYASLNKYLKEKKTQTNKWKK